MSCQTAVSSFRRLTPAIVASARLAISDVVPETTKAEIALLLKKAAPTLGINGTAYHVMDILLGLTRAEDWKGDNRPVVAISNAKLAEYTMRSERTIIRCIRKLVEVGIAAYRDSSSGRRFVQRDQAGAITTGFGIDFTPARVRLNELKQKVQDYQQRLALELEARRDVSRLSRALEDLALAFPAQAGCFSLADHDAQASIMDRADQLRDLYDLALKLVGPDFEGPMAAKGDMDVMPNTDTSFMNLERGSGASGEAQSETGNDPLLRKELGFRKSVVTAEAKAEAEFAETANAPLCKLETETLSKNKAKTACGTGAVPDPQSVETAVLAHIPMNLIRQACRDTPLLLGQSISNWHDLRRLGPSLCRLVGISEKAYHASTGRIGPFATAAVLATLVEKSSRDPDDILKPEAYFLAMVDRAREGHLRLDRTLHGLIKAQAQE
ncbi:plasmid replication protein RepC [Rhizobium sp. SSA_523]|uniref:plasmid replication protein RepC n=1 Tax=Rhizobium sp. SSA_523 TaxID=2952477 RepID=UPI0020900C07|nr:plasmid replication protein RepC [Rhizobium sp. SSA_523]MCO5733245.1 replication initiation protein RepC [Rhizobium sp. SSA_523]WKC21769.1 plasmid replication protein RepC [Rhizobium sp. SSA_523]